MKATEGFVKEKFDEFNKLIFNKKLPNIGSADFSGW